MGVIRVRASGRAKAHLRHTIRENRKLRRKGTRNERVLKLRANVKARIQDFMTSTHRRKQLRKLERQPFYGY